MSEFDKLDFMEKLYETEEPSLAEQFITSMASIIAERDELRKENIYLKKRIKFYQDSINERINEQNKFIGDLLTSLVDKND